MPKKKRCKKAYDRNRRSKLKANGKCVNCAKRKVLPSDSVRCLICTLKHLAYGNLGSAGRWRELLVLWIQQRGRCAYTHKKIQIGVDASIDHTIPRTEHDNRDINNIRWVHRDVNYSKHAKSTAEYIQLCKEVLEGFGYKVKRDVD